MPTVDTFKNRLLYFIQSQENTGGTSWEKIMDQMEHDIGIRPNPNTLMFKLKQLRTENKIRFISIGDHTIFKPF